MVWKLGGFVNVELLSPVVWDGWLAGATFATAHPDTTPEGNVVVVEAA